MNPKEDSDKRTLLTKPTLIMLHGYGVRGFFWEPFLQSKLKDVFSSMLAPDLDFSNIDTAVSSAKKCIQDAYKQIGNSGSLVVLGHSLGGILSALAANELGPEIVNKLIIMASPYGDTGLSNSAIKFQLWLLRHDWLLPDFITMPQFFSNLTPKSVQKMVWEQAVKENENLLPGVLTRRWFHTDILTEKLPMKSLFIASKKDKLIPFNQTEEFARVIGAEMFVPGTCRHDDLVFAPSMASVIIDRIEKFVTDV